MYNIDFGTNVTLVLVSMYTINLKKKKKKLPKDKGPMLFAQNPETCTQYKEKEISWQIKAWMRQTMPNVYKKLEHPKDKWYKKEKKPTF